MQKVAHGLETSAQIVCGNNVCSHVPIVSVDKAARSGTQIMVLKVFGRSGRDRCDEEEPLRSSAGERTVILLFLGNVTVGVSDDECVASGAQHILRPPNEAGEKGVGDVRNYHADGSGLVSPEASGNCVGMQPQFPDNAEYTCSALRRNA